MPSLLTLWHSASQTEKELIQKQTNKYTNHSTAGFTITAEISTVQAKQTMKLHRIIRSERAKQGSGLTTFDVGHLHRTTQQVGRTTGSPHTPHSAGNQIKGVTPNKQPQQGQKTGVKRMSTASKGLI